MLLNFLDISRYQPVIIEWLDSTEKPLEYIGMKDGIEPQSVARRPELQ
jgi:hypothetical protein